MNKLVLTGRVGKTPEVKTYEGGSKTTKFSLATTDGYGDKKEVNWHNIVIWGDYGEMMSKYITVGSQIGVAGKVTYSAYEKDGVKMVYTTIVCDQVELLDSKKSDSSDETSENPTQQGTSTPAASRAPRTSVSSAPVTPPPAVDDDLPF